LTNTNYSPGESPAGATSTGESPGRCYITRGIPRQVLHHQGNPPAGATSPGESPGRGTTPWALSFDKAVLWKGTNDRQQKNPHLKGMGL